MSQQALKQIMLQQEQIQRTYKSLNQKHRNSLNSNCLFGSIELSQKDLIHGNHLAKKFQIVQLKKCRPLQRNRNVNRVDSAIKSDVCRNTRQSNTHRDSFKLNRVEAKQLVIYKRDLCLKYNELPMRNIDTDAMKNSYLNQKQMYLSSENNVSENEKKSFLNIESLAERFIPNENYFISKQSSSDFKGDKLPNKQKGQNIRKGLTFDFATHLKEQQRCNSYSKTPNSFHSGQLQSSKIKALIKSQEAKQLYSNFTMNRATSMNNGVSKRPAIKKKVEQQKDFQQQIQQQKRQALQIRREVNKNYAKPFSPPENISATAYIVYQTTKQSKFRKSLKISNQKRKYFANGHKVLVQFNSRVPTQVASLTKIMTFLIALQICEKFKIKASTQKVKIGFFEQNISGTTANIKNGEIYSLEQLFYGLMLPSGNDASLAIAVWGGQVLLKKKPNYDSLVADMNILNKKKLYCERFLEEMNAKACQLNMEKTRYANTHGLMNTDNKSCSFDLAILCEYALKKAAFRKVVETKRFEGFITTNKEERQQQLCSLKTSLNTNIRNKFNEDQRQMKDFYANENYSDQEEKQRYDQTCQKETENLQIGQKYKTPIIWENTHALLHQKPKWYKGIKTGVTNAAGPCLSSYLEIGKRSFIIIVLNCKTMKQRYKDTQNLRRWAFQKEGISENQQNIIN